MMACPGCGAPTEDLALYRGSGSTLEVDVRPSWCPDCLLAKVQAARNDGDCRCSDPAHPHHAAPISGPASTGWWRQIAEGAGDSSGIGTVGVTAGGIMEPRPGG